MYVIEEQYGSNKKRDFQFGELLLMQENVLIRSSSSSSSGFTRGYIATALILESIWRVKKDPLIPDGMERRPWLSLEEDAQEEWEQVDATALYASLYSSRSFRFSLFPFILFLNE